MRGAVLFIALALAPCAALVNFAGRVVKAADGDTITLLVKKKQVPVRLDSIDAPETKQPFGRRLQQSLVQLYRRKRAIARRSSSRLTRNFSAQSLTS
jgi:micrococcal nuclease